MSAFDRKLAERGLDALERMAAAPDDNWWKGLLSLWRPSGAHAGDHGLRLAIRNGYLNFYRQGQSVARVSFDRTGRPVASVHVKYVYGEGETAQEYVRLTEAGIESERHEAVAYEGAHTLRTWIGNTRRHRSEEKRLVDDLVWRNPGVIDLEMGLPAWGPVKTAPRMDLVALEPAGAGFQVVFWEAKRVTDGRLRCRAAVKTDEKPEVLVQLARYRQFLAEPNHARRVVDAYREACRLTCRIHDMARAVGVADELDPAVREVATCGSPLGVAIEARLVVLTEGARYDAAAWALHKAKLRTAGVDVLVLDTAGPLGSQLGRAA